MERQDVCSGICYNQNTSWHDTKISSRKPKSNQCAVVYTTENVLTVNRSRHRAGFLECHRAHIKPHSDAETRDVVSTLHPELLEEQEVLENPCHDVPGDPGWWKSCAKARHSLNKKSNEEASKKVHATMSTSQAYTPKKTEQQSPRNSGDTVSRHSQYQRGRHGRDEQKEGQRRSVNHVENIIHRPKVVSCQRVPKWCASLGLGFAAESPHVVFAFRT